MSEYRVGIGVDAHAFAEGVPLVLAGVELESPRGLAGHSDGDVITHALIDALLGPATHSGRALPRSTCSAAPTRPCGPRAGSS